AELDTNAQAVSRRAAPREARADERPGVGSGEARRAAEHRSGRPARRQSQAGARPAAEERRRRGRESLTPDRRLARSRGVGRWQALFWLGPSLLLIAAVVLYPAIARVRASPTHYLH